MATEHKTKLDWFYFIKEIAEHYEEAEEVAQVINNLNTHKAGSLYEAFYGRRGQANAFGIISSSFTRLSTAVGLTWPRLN